MIRSRAETAAVAGARLLLFSSCMGEIVDICSGVNWAVNGANTDCEKLTGIQRTLDVWSISTEEPLWKEIAFVLLFKMEAWSSHGCVPCDVRVHGDCITTLLSSGSSTTALANVSCRQVNLWSSFTL